VQIVKDGNKLHTANTTDNHIMIMIKQ